MLPTLEIGGMEVLTVSMARGLRARGHEVGVTCLLGEGVLADALRADGIPVSCVLTPGTRTIVHAPRLVEHFRRIRPHVVHTHNGVWEKGARAARLANVPVVGHTLHGLHQNERWWLLPHLTRWAARHSDWVVPVSRELEAYLVGPARLRSTMVRHIINGVDTGRFAPGARLGPVRATLGLDGDTPLVGIVARLAPVKNHALLIAAFARTLVRVPDAHLAIVGDGELREALAGQIAEAGLGARVHLVGALQGMERIYRELDVFVLSSTTEGTPMSVLEAMASGVPVVATAVGGIPALLDDGVTGRLVPSHDRDALGDAMADLLADGAARQRMGLAARARVVERYSETAMLDAYERLYDVRATTQPTNPAPAPRPTTTLPEIAACAG